MRKNITFLLSFFIMLTLAISAGPVMAASSTKKEADKKTETSKKSTTKKVTQKETKKETTKKKTAAKKATDKTKTKKAATPFKGTVNVNKATKKDLMQLPGIGEVKADNILKARKKLGKFKKADDLLQVDGIGEKTLKDLKKHLKF